MKKTTLTVVVVLILLLLGGGAYGAYNYYRTYMLAVPVEFNVSSEGQAAASAFNKGKFDDAINITAKFLASHPNNPSALVFLASTYAQKGSQDFNEAENSAKAIEYAQKALELEPYNAEAYRTLGYAYEIRQDYINAIQSYTKSLEIEPSSADSLASRGHAYDLMGNLDAAASDYNAALVIDPNLDFALVNLGRIYYRKHNFAEAEKPLKDAITVTPNDRIKAAAWQTYGTMKIAEKDYPEAIDALTNAVAIDPTLPSAYIGLAQAKFFSLGSTTPGVMDSRMADILATAQKALNLNPNQTSVYILLGQVFTVYGDTNQAKKFFSLALNKVDTDITLGKTDKESTRHLLNSYISELK